MATTCPFYNGKNLDFTGNKYNDPYALIQKAGRKSRKTRGGKSRKTRGGKSRKTRGGKSRKTRRGKSRK